MHALIIEDDAMTAMMIEDELRELGYSTVDMATTELDAVEAVAKHCPDLVTVDGSLFPECGMNAVVALRSSVRVPVVLITADDTGARRDLPDAAVLEKPFSVSQLSAAIRRARADSSEAGPC